MVTGGDSVRCKRVAGEGGDRRGGATPVCRTDTSSLRTGLVMINRVAFAKVLEEAECMYVLRTLLGYPREIILRELDSCLATEIWNIQNNIVIHRHRHTDEARWRRLQYFVYVYRPWCYIRGFTVHTPRV